MASTTFAAVKLPAAAVPPALERLTLEGRGRLTIKALELPPSTKTVILKHVALHSGNLSAFGHVHSLEMKLCECHPLQDPVAHQAWLDSPIQQLTVWSSFDTVLDTVGCPRGLQTLNMTFDDGGGHELSGNVLDALARISTLRLELVGGSFLVEEWGISNGAFTYAGDVFPNITSLYVRH